MNGIALRTLSLPLYRLQLRALLGQRRTAALAVLALVPAVGAAVFAAVGEISPETFWARLVQRLLLPTVVSLVAVVIGASALGDEREEGTILYLAATPLPRLTLVASAVAAAWTAAVALLVPSTLVSGALALGGDAGAEALLWPVVGVLLGSLAYISAAVWLSLRVRRPVVVGILYILLWEGSIATFAASADRFSVAAYSRRLAIEGVADVNAPDVSAAAALIVLLAIAAAGLALAARALRRVELP